MGGGGHVAIKGIVEVALAPARGKGRHGGDGAGHGERGSHELVCGHDLVDQADGKRLLRSDDAGGEGELQRLGDAHDAGEEVAGAELWVEADAEEDGAHLGLLRCYADVAGERDAEAEADGGAVDRGDGGLGHGAHGEGQLL